MFDFCCLGLFLMNELQKIEVVLAMLQLFVIFVNGILCIFEVNALLVRLFFLNGLEHVEMKPNVVLRFFSVRTLEIFHSELLSRCSVMANLLGLTDLERINVYFNYKYYFVK